MSDDVVKKLSSLGGDQTDLGTELVEWFRSRGVSPSDAIPAMILVIAGTLSHAVDRSEHTLDEMLDSTVAELREKTRGARDVVLEIRRRRTQ